MGAEQSNEPVYRRERHGGRARRWFLLLIFDSSSGLRCRATRGYLSSGHDRQMGRDDVEPQSR